MEIKPRNSLFSIHQRKSDGVDLVPENVFGRDVLFTKRAEAYVRVLRRNNLMESYQIACQHVMCHQIANVIVNAISVSSIRDTHSVLYLNLPRFLTVCLFSSAICCRKANLRQNTSPLMSFRMALPRSISCRGLGFGTGWGNNVTRYSCRIDLQTTKEVRRGSKARLFTSSSSRATLDFVSSSRPSASGLPHDHSRSRTLPTSLHNSASLSRIFPRCQNLNTMRQYQNMASRPESEDGEAKKGITFKVENQTTPAEPTTLPPSIHASSTSKPPIPPLDSSPSSPSHDSIPTNAQQRQTDWRIIKRLMINVWPRNDWKTRLTVLGGFGLLVSAKVRLLNRSVLESSNSFFAGPQCSSPADFQSSNRFTQC